jgi:hypothetical protein
MIYERANPQEPLQQGDIFRSVPRPDFSLNNLAILSSEGQAEQVTWRELVEHGDTDGVTAIIGIKPVMAIVISQNCDTARGRDISLCAVEPLAEHMRDKFSTNPKGWNNQLLKHAHNPRYFYLPADGDLGIEGRMSADFRSVIRVDREDLLNLRVGYRIARLNDVAAEHFRESLAQFFRRYPVNEWYPLTKEEVAVYAEVNGLSSDDFYDWQK